jgi:hypothetical protein
MLYTVDHAVWAVPGLEDLRAELPAYIQEMRRTKSQPGKEIIFTRFVEHVFGIKPETMTLEVPVTSKVMIVRGRVDAVFGNILIEFKVNLNAELDDAKRELTKYFQSYHETSPEKSYIGIAHDGLSFKVFQPVFGTQPDSTKPMVTSVRETDSLDLGREQDLERIFLWFDSYLFISEKTVPTSEDIKKRLGTDSPTFFGVLGRFEYFFEIAMKAKRNRVKYSNWAKTLEIVYGDQVDDRTLFIKHTYLATVAKLLIHLIVARPKVVSKTDVRAIVYGDVFTQYDISNYIEEDYYTWILDKEIRYQAIDVIFSLAKELMIYDLEKVDEDFLKSLYEQLVDPELRHDLGEYYTPDWLAQYIVRTLLENNSLGSVLDPACGSGTFLFSTIRYKIQLLEREGTPYQKIIEHVTSNVIGADIHPLAVLIARTNYLLALRRLLQHRGNTRITIPIYMSDTLRMPRVSIDISTPEPAYQVEAIEKTRFLLPSVLMDTPQMLDIVIDRMGAAAKEYERIREEYPATSNSVRQNIEKGFETSISQLINSPTLVQASLSNLKKLLDLVETDSNSIWSFILKNVYKPVALSNRKFDYVIGNPPWLTIHFMKNKQYREFLIEESKKLGLVDRQESHQIPNIELATLFFQESCRSYLKHEGAIGFVMPKSVLLAEQHKGFRKWEVHHVKPIEIVDLEHVKPLFNVPACVVMGKKLN